MRRWPHGIRFGAALAVLLLVAYLDFSTPSYISITGFYFLPVFFALWFCEMPAAVFVLALAALFNIAETVLSDEHRLTAVEAALSATSLFIVHAGFAALIYVMKGIVSKLEAESRTDALTGLKNRRGFIEILEQENRRKKRFDRGLVLVSIDIDHFKSVNDSQGHAVGDALLIAIAQCLLASLRDIDTCSRLGGDEFLVLLPSTSREEAEPVLQRLHAKLRPMVRQFGANVSASVGALVVSSTSELSLPDILRKADTLMYSVKHRGKDNLVISDASAELLEVPAAYG